MISKVTRAHPQRTAYFFVRQPTVRQGVESTESTRRRHGRRDRAMDPGWREELVVVLDCDLGKSGTAGRTGVRQSQRVSLMLKSV